VETYFKILSLLAILAIAHPHFAIAEVHSVMVKNRSFSPNDLIIKSGDTVEWMSESSEDCGGPYGDDCVTHTVTADDFSFESGEPSEDLYFTRDFNEAGVILYHCRVHSLPGQDIDSSMNGRITVKAEQTAFRLNAGLNDAWYNPATDGQGFFITVFPELGFVSLAWFTYDTELPAIDINAFLGDTGHRWLTALGSFVDNQAVMNIDITSGGIFDTPTEIQHTDPAGSDGTIILTFDDCDSGTVEYVIPSINKQGTVPITRFAEDNKLLCEALSANEITIGSKLPIIA